MHRSCFNVEDLKCLRDRHRLEKMNIYSNGNGINVCDLQEGLATVALLSADQSGPDVAADVVDVRVAAGAALDATVGDYAASVRIQL